jgi:hypothetical protein
MWDDARYRLSEVLSWDKLTWSFTFNDDLNVLEYEVQHTETL